MSIYTDKIAYLVSLIEQLKRYPFDDLNDLYEMAHVEHILDIPEIADRDWEKEHPIHQKTFLRFLNICISIYEETLKQLKEKTTHSRIKQNIRPKTSLLRTFRKGKTTLDSCSKGLTSRSPPTPLSVTRQSHFPDQNPFPAYPWEVKTAVYRKLDDFHGSRPESLGLACG